jgi:hypothetical protein
MNDGMVTKGNRTYVVIPDRAIGNRRYTNFIFFVSTKRINKYINNRKNN